MSAHEFMNMARVRAEQAEARAAKAEAERDALAELLYEAKEREKALKDRFGPYLTGFVFGCGLVAAADLIARSIG